MNIQDAKVGQRVYTQADKFLDFNPDEQSSSSNVGGKVLSVDSSQVVVEWDNGWVITHLAESFKSVFSDLSVVTISLENAVITVIHQAFVDEGLSFSAHDITQAIREDVNEGRLRINSLPIEDVDGLQTQRISHESVREIVRRHMETVVGYEDRTNGTYIVYTRIVPTSQSTQTLAVAPTLTFTPTAVLSNIIPSTPKTSSDFEVLIQSYLTARGPRTLKQIQSRIKDDAPTVAEIHQIANSLGLQVQINEPYHASIVSI